MTREELYGTIRDTLRDQFEIPEESITLQADLYEDLDIDSIDAVDLVVRMRDFTGVRLDPETFKSVRTVNDVIEAMHVAINKDQ